MRFKWSADAIKTLSLKDHRPFDEIVRVSPAIRDPILSCSGKRAQLSITDLNDDCLVEIFRLLPVKDLWNVVDTCRRFRIAGKMAFPLINQASNMMVEYDDDREEESVEEINAVLMKFGSEISELKIVAICGSTHHTIFRLDHCGEKLKTLYLQNLHINTDMASQIKAIAENLDSLILEDCDIDDSAETNFLSECKRLMKFELYTTSFGNMGNPNKLRLENVPQLKCLLLDFDDSELINDPNIEHLLRSQLKLQRLTVGGISLAPENNILKIIIENRYENLKELHLLGFKIDKGMIPRVRSLFSHLESLDLNCYGRDILNADNLFTECKQLKKFIFPGIYNLTTTATDFPRLESLRISNFHVFEETSIQPFDEFLKIHLNKLKELELHLHESNTKSIFEFIVSKDNSKNLKKLTVHYSYNDFHICIPLSTFDNIKTLKLSCGTNSSTASASVMTLFLQNLASIKTLNHLELTNVILDNDMIFAISKMKKVRHLELYNFGAFDSSLTLDVSLICKMRQLCVLKIVGKWSIDDVDPIKLVTSLKKLAVLSLSLEDFKLDYETYNKMIEIVHARQRSITILTREEDMYCHYSLLYIERDV